MYGHSKNIANRELARKYLEKRSVYEAFFWGLKKNKLFQDKFYFLLDLH